MSNVVNLPSSGSATNIRLVRLSKAILPTAETDLQSKFELEPKQWRNSTAWAIDSNFYVFID